MAAALASAARAHKHRADKPGGPPCGDDLRHLAAHRMADQHVAIKPECASNSFSIVSHGAQIISPVCRD